MGEVCKQTCLLFSTQYTYLHVLTVFARSVAVATTYFICAAAIWEWWLTKSGIYLLQPRPQATSTIFIMHASGCVQVYASDWGWVEPQLAFKHGNYFFQQRCSDNSRAASDHANMVYIFFSEIYYRFRIVFYIYTAPTCTCTCKLCSRHKHPCGKKTRLMFKFQWVLAYQRGHSTHMKCLEYPDVKLDSVSSTLWGRFHC